MANKDFGASSGTMNDAASSMGNVASRLQEKASELGQKASEFGQNAVEAVDARRGAAASTLESAAAGIHANASRLPPSVSPFADEAADQFGAAASYVRENRMQDMLSDVEGSVRAHPVQALLGAVALGFLAGLMLRRN